MTAFGLDVEALEGPQVSQPTPNTSTSSSESESEHLPFEDYSSMELFSKSYVLKNHIGNAHKGWKLEKVAHPLSSHERGLQASAVAVLDGMVHARESDELFDKEVMFTFSRRTGWVKGCFQ